MFKDFSFIVDIDGTICPIKGKDEKYETDETDELFISLRISVFFVTPSTLIVW